MRGKLIDKINVIFDLDGSVADCTHRLPLIAAAPKDWEKFHAECINDKPIHDILHLLYIMESQGYNAVICTGRPERSRGLTMEWLRKHKKFPDNHIMLLMRPDGDYDDDTVVKERLLAAAGITPENTLFVVDDRSRVVKHLRSIGFTVLQCADGDY